MRSTMDPVLVALDTAARSEAPSRHVAVVLQRADRELATATGPMTWESIPLEVFGRPLPDGIKSCWVFVIRGGAATGAERHPNSHQRSLSLMGRGEFQLRQGGRWESHPLVSDPSAPPEHRWVDIPRSTWHRLFVGDGNWGMLSFHTVAPEELIEERPVRPDDLDDGPTERHRYQDEGAGHRATKPGP